MGRPQECAKLLKKGYSPSEVADQLDIAINSVLPYLFRAIGMGLIRRVDVLFSLDKVIRKEIEEIISELPDADAKLVLKELRDRELAVDERDLEIYLDLRKQRVSASDLYELISELERTLHGYLARLLKEEYGRKESGWWRRGVPQNVRIDCVTLRERDEEPPTDPPYSYTTFFHLVKILDKNWALFQKHLPASVAADKRQLLRDLYRVGGIRNRVMHPVRGGPPAQDDVEFVREVHRSLVNSAWR